jgi:hypothetical protein
MKSTRLVTGMAASGRAAMPGGANRQTFSPTMAAQIEFPNDRRRKDECTDRRVTARWSSVFAFLMEGLAAYGVAVHGVSIEAILTCKAFPPVVSTPHADPSRA